MVNFFYDGRCPLRPLASDLESVPELTLSQSYGLPLCQSGSFFSGLSLPDGGDFSGVGGGGLRSILKSSCQPAPPEL